MLICSVGLKALGYPVALVCTHKEAIVISEALQTHQVKEE